MKRLVNLAVLLSILLLVRPAYFMTADDPARQVHFGARLSGFREVPANSTTGKGVLTVELGDNNTISYTLKFSKLEGKPSVAHIHFGQPLVSGGVIAFLCGEGGKPSCIPDQDITGTITSSDVIGPEDQGIATGEFEEVLRAIRHGDTYVNVHSDKFPKGEIRGQIWPRRVKFGSVDELFGNN